MGWLGDLVLDHRRRQVDGLHAFDLFRRRDGSLLLHVLDVVLPCRPVNILELDVVVVAVALHHVIRRE